MAAANKVNPAYKDPDGDIDLAAAAKARSLVQKGAGEITYTETNNPCLKCAKTYGSYGNSGFNPCKMPDYSHPRAAKTGPGGKKYYKCESCTLGNNSCLAVRLYAT